MKMHKLGT